MRSALTPGTLAFAVAWAIALALFELASLTSVSMPEVVLAAALGICGAVLAVLARRQMASRRRLPHAWPTWLAALPAAVVADTARLTVLGAHPVRLRGTPGILRRLAVTDPVEEVEAGRAGAGGLILSASPGSYVVDHDLDRRLLTIHVLVEGSPDLAGRIAPSSGHPDHSAAP